MRAPSRHDLALCASRGAAACVLAALACGSPPTSEAGVESPAVEPAAPSEAAQIAAADEPGDAAADVAAQAPAPEEGAPPAPPRVDSAFKCPDAPGPGVADGPREFFVSHRDAGCLWLGALAGNGGREVLIFIPAGADPQADFRVVYHFHGTYSEHLEREGPGVPKKRWVGWNRLEQTIGGAAELQATVPENVALVYPLSAGKRMEPEWRGWSNKAYDRMWMRPAPPKFTDDFAALHREVTAALTDDLGVHPSRLPAKVVAEGHSAGGIALWNVARDDDGLVRDYIFLDAGFHEWADGCHAAIRARGSGARVVLVIRDEGIADPLVGPNDWCATHPRLAEAWPKVQAECAADPKAKPKAAPGEGTIPCADWRRFAEGWPEVAEWCAGMAEDMKDVDDVLVRRTKVVHGDQPRHFFGGLRIPGLVDGAAPAPVESRSAGGPAQTKLRPR
ncbi:MAG: hypothetical protein R3A79_16925 [Nannocystaceae bacterium]